jgi:hypothetical protein
MSEFGEMVVSTPQTANSSSLHHALHTRDDDPESPSNLARHQKRRSIAPTSIHPPPLLDLGAGAPQYNSVSNAITTHFDAIDHQARVKRDVLHRLGRTIDDFCSSFKQQSDEGQYARDLGDQIVLFLRTGIFAETSRQASLHVTGSRDSRPSSDRTAPSNSTSGLPTYAGVLKTPNSSGGHQTHQPISQSGKRPAGAAPKTPQLPIRKPSPAQEDRRLLVTAEPNTLLNRPEIFALRQALCREIPGLTLAAIPTISPTRTGWAITPADHTTRDLLLSAESTAIILQVLKGTEVRQHEQWINFAIPGVPHSIYLLDGTHLTITPEMIKEEVTAQTKQTPVSCRQSRHGVDPSTGKLTWIVSFLRTTTPPPRGFTVFNTSELARLITKKTPISRHEQGCQSWCNPVKCRRYARCSNCGVRKDLHEGPQGDLCQASPSCINCAGPFPAGHQYCPAAPHRKNGVLVRLTKKELAAVRRHGNRQFLEARNQKEADRQLQEQLLAGRSPAQQPVPGARVTAYEQACSTQNPVAVPATAPSSSIGKTSTVPQTAACARKRRQTATGRSLNIIALSNEAHGPLEEDEDHDMTITVDSQC